MPKSLVVVESPAKAKTIKKILGKDYIVESSVGHIRDLPKKELGVDIENAFAPKYVLIRGKGKVVKSLRTAAGKVDNIYLAADPDREGEAICWHLAEELKKTKKPIHRITYNEVTKSAILDAIETPGKINIALVDAQQARRVLDRLVGYLISPILWRSVKPGLSAGRVQSVAVRLICEREAEIEAFKSEEYWTLTATLTPIAVEHPFPAKLHKIGSKKGEINNYGFRIDEARAKELAADAKTHDYIVEKVQKRERKQRPVPPFITSTLQQEASRKLRFTAKKTMLVAQQLYEGLEISKEGSVGLITYMRTDSTRIAQEALQAVRDYIKTTYGTEYLPGRAVNYRGKKGAQDAHEAIRPTLPLRLPAELKPYLNSDQYRLYELIWMRFIASQMNPAIFDATTIDVKAGTYLFRATGSVIKFDGFRRIYMEGKDDTAADETDSSEENVRLPVLKEGDRLDLRKLEPKQHWTQPPPRYNEATLVKMLEAQEIGRPSTYASILSTIQDRGYVNKERGRLLPTDVGRLVNHLLIHGFPNIVDVEFTAKMEEQLDTIADGKVAWVKTLGQFYPPFQIALAEAPDKMYEARKAMEEESDEKCEKCGGNMIVKWGRYGRFLGCANYPECKSIKPLTTDDTPAPEPEETDTACDKCGEPMVIRVSRAGSKFLSCSAYPKCKNAKPIPMGIDCPEAECDGYLGERRSRRGKVFYGCSNYPKCEFSTWDKPVPETCPECNAPFLVEKTKKAKDSETVTALLSCYRSDCDYTKG
ncbi:type I DNA topoisomerase [Candidatus Poribacteria bacterium]|nr:type I DNA topoisomerase [Candidatus Poribacteria bacterium]MYH80963.1 type I DNA topoisomerase [Candidatus Poribacteria bacterium]MYK93170.1 type I DNA topoisomerase [Candidatus Poribacteria bacterium]